MASKKPKPATAGEKIVKGTHIWHPSAFKSPTFDKEFASRIDRAIARAVKKERERCAAWVQLVEEGKIDAQAARIAIEWGEVVAEPDDPIAREADAALARAERRMMP